MLSELSAKEATRVLVWVDQQPMAELIRLTLNHGVCVTREVSDGPGAMAVLDEWRPEIAVIDLDIANGLFEQIAGESEDQPTRLPVLGLTRRGDLKTKLAAFEKGIDDIVTVPFSPEELLARVIAIARRAYRRPMPVRPVLKLGEMEIDILNRLVRVGSTLLHLTGLEQSLLYYLAANAGRLVTRDEILDAVWGVDLVADSNLVDRHIRNLREKLQDDWRRPRFIATVSGQGYRFIPTYSDHVTD